jgi:hypothetical protein
MTIEQLNATPLFSTVTYTAKTAVTGVKATVEGVIVKIRNNEARVWDVTNGHLSYYVPADIITLKSAFAPPAYPAPTSFVSMPLYSIVSYQGANAFLIEKEIVQNEFIPDGSGDIQNATLWFRDEEILLNAIPATQITFVSAPTQSVIPPTNGNNTTGTTNWILYGAIAIGLYFLLMKKEKGPTA